MPLSSAPFPLGKTLYQGQDVPTGSDLTYSEGILGHENYFDHKSVPTEFGPILLTSQKKICARLVRNVSGIALLPGYTVTWRDADGIRNKEVDGYARTTAAEVAGIVDPFLPSSGVRDDDVFWLIVAGPVLAKTSLAGNAENVISRGDIMYALTAATSQATTAGRVISYAATTGTTTALSQILNRIGRAMSAKTTDNTNADVLVDVHVDRR